MTYIDQYLHYSSHHRTSCEESVVSSLFSRAYSIITNKDNITKENARIIQVLKENGYQESIFSEFFKRITGNHSLTLPQQQTQATGVQEMSIKLPYIEDTIERLQRILRSNKIRSTFYIESKTTSFSNMSVITEKLSTSVNLKWCSDKRKRSVKNCNCEKNENAISIVPPDLNICTTYHLRENIFTCLFSVQNNTSSELHEKVRFRT